MACVVLSLSSLPFRTRKEAQAEGEREGKEEI
jgi:hypothetical protein